ncbi:MAG: hypothetical protein ACRDL5_09210, partial [Solirubrobacteraceae bacterium]
LRDLSLRSDGDQARLTRELSQMIGYPARFEAALRPLNPAVRRLAHALGQRTGASTAAIYAARAQALVAFRGVVQRLAAHLRALSVPAVFGPGYRAELGALAQMSSSAAGLARAIRHGGAGSAASLRSLQRAFGIGSSAGVRRAETAAVRGYDRQLQQLNALGAQIQQELQRLSASVR